MQIGPTGGAAESFALATKGEASKTQPATPSNVEAAPTAAKAVDPSSSVGHNVNVQA